MGETRPKSGTPSVYKGSAEVVECPCTPCAREGSDIEAINFCTDCSEYFCLGCTKQHKKFGMTASHNTVDRRKAGQVVRGNKQLPTERCQEHNGELITWFCIDHDVVVCNSCAIMDHRSCENMRYIPKHVSHDSKMKKAVPRVKTEISASLKDTRDARQQVQKHQTEIDDEKADRASTIKANTERLIAHARDMEKAALADVTRHHEEASVKIKTELAQLDDTEAVLERRQKNIYNANTTSVAQTFVDVKLGSREVAAARQRLTSVGSSRVRSTFMVDDRVDRFVNDVNSLGKVMVNWRYMTVLKSKVDVKSKVDETTCDIYDSTELPGGEILMTDCSNRCIKVLDRYVLVKRFQMSTGPWGICQTFDNEIAVTMLNAKRVQFIDISGSWTLTKSFPVHDRCRGIAYSDGDLFVSCGGFPGNVVFDAEGPGFVAIYDTSGSLKRKIKLDAYLSLPYHIATTKHGDNIHVADKKTGVITFDRKCVIKSIFHENIQKAIGLCAMDDENIFVCGMKSDNVLQITSRGELITEMLTKKDRIKKPVSIHCTRDKSKLIVTFENSNEIKVFELIIESE